MRNCWIADRTVIEHQRYKIVEKVYVNISAFADKS
jgi:uncharacterized protein YkvS